MSSVNLNITKDCPVVAVTVYSDRAEVIRKINIPIELLNKKAPLTVIINGQTTLSNPDSIRIRGTGPLQIQEVSHEIKSLSKTEMETNSLLTNEIHDTKEIGIELRNKLDEVINRIKLVNQQIKILENQRELVEGYVRNILNPQITVNQQATSTINSKADISSAKEVISFYSVTISSLDESNNDLQLKLEQTKKEQAEINFELRKIESSSSTLTQARQIILHLEVTTENEGDDVELFLSYLVSNASWTPSYDIRVDTTTQIMSLYYYVSLQVNNLLF